MAYNNNFSVLHNKVIRVASFEVTFVSASMYTLLGNDLKMTWQSKAVAYLDFKSWGDL